MMSELKETQRAVKAWSTKNFGDQPSYRPLLGIVEEVGELCHAHLKGEQGIRHTPEEILSLKKDALGDILIYVMDYCSREGLSLDECLFEAWKEVARRDWRKENE
jgi:NTP pyrophosphatase (non-canonical NTP hydrolase)